MYTSILKARTNDTIVEGKKRFVIDTIEFNACSSRGVHVNKRMCYEHGAMVMLVPAGVKASHEDEFLIDDEAIEWAERIIKAVDGGDVGPSEELLYALFGNSHEHEAQRDDHSVHLNVNPKELERRVNNHLHGEVTVGQYLSASRRFMASAQEFSEEVTKGMQDNFDFPYGSNEAFVRQLDAD